jgi:hypothetical protein
MNAIKKAICGGMIGLAGLVGANGCTAVGEQNGRNFFGGLVGVAAGTAVQSSIEGQLNPNQTNVYVNNQIPQQGYQTPQTNGTGNDSITTKDNKFYGTITGYEGDLVFMRLLNGGNLTAHKSTCIIEDR